MWPWGIQLMLCYKKRTIYIWHIFQTIRNTVRISIRKNLLMALKIEVQTLTINFCSWVDPLWICMKTKYPKSRKIQNRITLFEFMSLFHWNIVILNNVLFLIIIFVLILVMFWFLGCFDFGDVLILLMFWFWSCSDLGDVLILVMFRFWWCFFGDVFMFVLWMFLAFPWFALFLFRYKHVFSSARHLFVDVLENQTDKCLLKWDIHWCF